MKNVYSKIAILTVLMTTLVHSEQAYFNNYWGIPFQSSADVLEYVKRLLPDSPIILEAGAHFGEDTINMKSIWPDATIHAFEPLPDSFKVMRKNLMFTKNTHCYPLALSDHNGVSQFYINPGNSGACSINAPVIWNTSEFETTPTHIHCMTLDTWADLYDVTHIDFMWLDMEGHELYALQHGTKILESVSAIYTEVSYIPVRINSCGYTDIKTFLEQHGFTEVWRWEVGNGYGDALFIKKELLNKN